MKSTPIGCSSEGGVLDMHLTTLLVITVHLEIVCIYRTIFLFEQTRICFLSGDVMHSFPFTPLGEQALSKRGAT